MQLNSVRNTSTAFTLVELLVVMAIVTILAALLLPALRGTVENARTVKCLSNMKQMGMASSMYWAQYNGQGFWPVTWDDNMSEWCRYNWWTRLMQGRYDGTPYLDQGAPTYKGGDATLYFKGVFVCPSRPEYYNGAKQDYSQCSTYVASAGKGYYSETGSILRIANIKEPSFKFFITCQSCGGFCINQAEWNMDICRSHGAQKYTINGLTTMLYYDLHAATLRLTPNHDSANWGEESKKYWYLATQY